MKLTAQELAANATRLFNARMPLLSLWQEIGEQFNPFRADFTRNHNLGSEFSQDVMTGFPFLACRDLSNMMSAMLRPPSKVWFHARTTDDKVNEDADARKWLDRASDVQRRLMYDRKAQFIRATKEGDQDFAAFGQCAISVDVNKDNTGLLYRSWHLRDIVWQENQNLEIDTVYRKWQLTAREICRLFPETVSEELKNIAHQHPDTKVDCLHILLPTENYDSAMQGDKKAEKFPFTSIYIATAYDLILEDKLQRTFNYVIPRWGRIPGSQYAFSLATAIALPDARMLQQISMTLLEAGQKAVDPALKATKEAILGGVNVFPGGITWVDAEYDERQGAALEQLISSSPQLNWGERREEKIEALIRRAFYLDQLTLPSVTPTEMTLGEVNQRVDEYERSTLPVIEPWETEYNGGLCDITFELAWQAGAFGSPDAIPPVLRGKEIKFAFQNPLMAATERAKPKSFMETAQLIKIASEMSPKVAMNFDVVKATRDAVIGGGAPSSWVLGEAQVAEAQAAMQEQEQQQQQMQQISQAAQLAQQVGAGAQQLGAGVQQVQGAVNAA